MRHFVKIYLGFFLLICQVTTYANENPYKINSGDVLEISVWKEKELQREIRVLPDGHISFPLVGDLAAAGLTLTQVKDVIAKKLAKFISDPVVNISVKAVDGNMVYVLGQVKQPGQFNMYQPLDVMQVLSLAGGLTTFAKANDIIILRRDEKGGSQSIKIEYGEFEEGNDLEKNIVLKSGDVIVVP